MQTPSSRLTTAVEQSCSSIGQLNVSISLNGYLKELLFRLEIIVNENISHIVTNLKYLKTSNNIKV